MSKGSRILIVDDDVQVRAVFRRSLEQAHFRVDEARDGQEALDFLAEHAPELVILDVEMPRMDGWKTLRELRRRGWSQPILMMTHVNDVDSRIRGLEGGADDYLGKPCGGPELLARVRALLRRAGQGPRPEAAPLRFGRTIVDLDRMTAERDGLPLRLTRTEFALLTVLRDQAGRPVTRETLLARVWSGATVTPHALDTHLWRLRRKLGDTGDEAHWIRNLPGIGYVMESDPAE